MKTFTTKQPVHQYLLQLKATGKSIGFVATMGALHQGHLSLIQLAKQQNDIVVCSIFVNPTQFNDPKDLEKYPRTLDADSRLLEGAGCDVLFAPGVNQMYDDNEQWHLNIGETEHLLEGEFRPGHYQGVTQVVYKLFNIIPAGRAYFGQKDYQQFLIISKMVQMLKLPVELVMCPIMREPGGLAMSSRNVHLSADDRQHALVLSGTLNHIKDKFTPDNIAALKQEAAQLINAEPGVALEYFEIADGETLHEATPQSKTIVALVAAKVGNTRLIDNVVLAGG
ncbi:pantoate--beta-alanine ligase [Mucilaginibacter sp. L3T2-6]|uniref:pantoate--beta-alanine ligase n=1 Tax=Mucilaginibacter sp. L3T2-6 TaxID=3062491 RepID=UPI002676A2A7|nr:pantoate--beta-alanine ligase [Mucilaginibacter sp. L3T2-6]MDO3641998.1 pantoate--beta-alanine ligase [Mucilaginibacter sp. L3T2-6]MDV6214324.1 pantoate--beta-alanine ligase [Mucilaginibacter sp. L3T2-6]